MRKIGIVIVLFLLAVTGIGGHVFYQVSKNIKNTIPVYEQPIDFPTYPQLNRQPSWINRQLKGQIILFSRLCCSIVGIAFK